MAPVDDLPRCDILDRDMGRPPADQRADHRRFTGLAVIERPQGQRFARALERTAGKIEDDVGGAASRRAELLRGQGIAKRFARAPQHEAFESEQSRDGARQGRRAFDGAKRDAGVGKPARQPLAQQAMKSPAAGAGGFNFDPHGRRRLARGSIARRNPSWR